MMLVAKDKINPQLSSPSVVHWLQTRYKKSTREHYIKTRKQLEFESEIREVFQWLDQDKKGYITPKDLARLFKQVNLNIGCTQIRKLFDLCDAKVRNRLDMEDFKKLYASQRVEEELRS
jgi:Ca2+-binding EF-hand superfamily protein